MYRTEILSKEFWEDGVNGRGHDMVRRMDRQAEVLTWCRKSSGYARQRMRPKLMNRCTPAKVGTREFGEMLKRIHVLEEAKFLVRKRENGKLKDEKEELQARNTVDCGRSSRREVSWRRKGSGMLPERKSQRVEIKRGNT